jgi:hypothetical protein
MFLKIMTFQREGLLKEYFIDIAHGSNNLQAFMLRVKGKASFLVEIHLVCRDADQQIVAELARTLENAQMADMEDVKCAEGDHAFHLISPPPDAAIDADGMVCFSAIGRKTPAISRDVCEAFQSP